MKITISNGSGRFHLYHAGAGASQASILSFFLTGFYLKYPWQESLLKSKLINFLISEPKVQKGLLRQDLDIDNNSVKPLIIPELIHSTSKILSSLSNNLANSSVYVSHLLFGLQSVPYVKNCDIFHVRSCFGRYCMSVAKQHGAICLVDHTIAHPNYLEKVSKQETDYWGKPSDQQSGGLYWKTCLEDLNEADYILTNSEFVKDTIIQESNFSSDKIFSIPMGINTNIFNFDPRTKDIQRIGQTNDKFRFLYVGSLSYRKGILYLLEAWKTLNLVGAELLVVGSVSNEIKPFLDNYQDINIQFISHLPHSRISEVYHSCDVFVFPSLAEGSALVTYEAMACGLPIITTLNSGSVMRHGVDGYLVPPRDIEALASKIDWFYHHRHEAKEMGFNASDNIKQNYTWQNYKSSLIHLYTQIMTQYVKL